MELLHTPFLTTAQGNLPSTVTFPTFSLLIIISVFLTFTVNFFDSNAHFQAASFPPRPSSVSQTNVKSSA